MSGIKVYFCTHLVLKTANGHTIEFNNGRPIQIPCGKKVIEEQAEDFDCELGRKIIDLNFQGDERAEQQYVEPVKRKPRATKVIVKQEPEDEFFIDPENKVKIRKSILDQLNCRVMVTKMEQTDKDLQRQNSNNVEVINLESDSIEAGSPNPKPTNAEGRNEESSSKKEKQRRIKDAAQFLETQAACHDVESDDSWCEDYSNRVSKTYKRKKRNEPDSLDSFIVYSSDEDDSAIPMQTRKTFKRDQAIKELMKQRAEKQKKKRFITPTGSEEDQNKEGHGEDKQKKNKKRLLISSGSEEDQHKGRHEQDKQKKKRNRLITTSGSEEKEDQDKGEFAQEKQKNGECESQNTTETDVQNPEGSNTAASLPKTCDSVQLIDEESLMTVVVTSSWELRPLIKFVKVPTR